MTPLVEAVRPSERLLSQSNVIKVKSKQRNSNIDIDSIPDGIHVWSAGFCHSLYKLLSHLDPRHKWNHLENLEWKLRYFKDAALSYRWLKCLSLTSVPLSTSASMMWTALILRCALPWGTNIFTTIRNKTNGNWYSSGFGWSSAQRNNAGSFI